MLLPLVLDILLASVPCLAHSRSGCHILRLHRPKSPGTVDLCRSSRTSLHRSSCRLSRFLHTSFHLLEHKVKIKFNLISLFATVFFYDYWRFITKLNNALPVAFVPQPLSLINVPRFLVHSAPAAPLVLTPVSFVDRCVPVEKRPITLGTGSDGRHVTVWLHGLCHVTHRRHTDLRASSHSSIFRSTSCRTCWFQVLTRWRYRTRHIGHISILLCTRLRTSSTVEFLFLQEWTVNVIHLSDKKNKTRPQWRLASAGRLTVLPVVQPLSCVLIAVWSKHRVTEAAFLRLQVQLFGQRQFFRTCFNIRHNENPTV